jgi:putative polymerase
VFSALIATAFILADDRLAAVTCLVLLMARMMPPPPATALWLLPFVVVAALILGAAMFPAQEVDQSIYGRLVGAGRLIASFDVEDWLGIGDRPFAAMLDVDSGYAYAIYAVGLPGLIILWTAFSFARDYTVEGARYRMLLTLYISIGFCVSQSAFSIKTAALAWFLLGATQVGEANLQRTQFGIPLPLARNLVRPI